MRKLYSLLLLCLIGTVSAWAATTTLYERTNTDWDAADISETEWSGVGSPTLSINGGLAISGGNGDNSATKDIFTNDNTILEFTATWNTGSSTGNNGNYNFLKFGDVELQAWGQAQRAYIVIGGQSTQLSSNTNDVRNNATWTISITINKATSEVSYSITLPNAGEKSGTGSITDNDFSSVSFGFHKGGRTNSNNSTLVAIGIKETAQEVTLTDYKINYIYDNEIKKVVTGTSAVGIDINAESPITINSVKYYAADGATTSMKLVKDATSNVLDVNLRTAGTQTVKINAVDSDNNLLKTFSDTRVEGDAAANLYYTRAVEKGGKYYTVPAANANAVNYGVTMTYGSADVDKIYTLDESISYYAEETELNLSGSFRANSQVLERASGGSWNNLTANSYLYTDGLNSGIYKVEVSARNHGSGEGSLAIQVRSADGDLISTAGTVAWGAANCSVQMVEGVAVPENAVIAIAETAGATSNVDIDYLIAYRTGDLTEDIAINSTGVSSYVTTYALDFSDVEGLTAMIAEDETEEQIILRKVTEVPAGTAIIIRGTPCQTYTVPAGSCTELEGNLLQGSVTQGFDVSTATMPVYALKNSDGEFHHVASTVVIPAKKAYLISHFDNAASAKGFKVLGEEGEEATAVSAVSAAEGEKSAKLYNAAGQLVGAAYKGFVIDENGKKYVR